MSLRLRNRVQCLLVACTVKYVKVNLIYRIQKKKNHRVTLRAAFSSRNVNHFFFFYYWTFVICPKTMRLNLNALSNVCKIFALDAWDKVLFPDNLTVEYFLWFPCNRFKSGFHRNSTHPVWLTFVMKLLSRRQLVLMIGNRNRNNNSNRIGKKKKTFHSDGNHPYGRSGCLSGVHVGWFS